MVHSFYKHFIWLTLFAFIATQCSSQKAIVNSTLEDEIKKYREEKKREFLTSERSPLKTESEVSLMDFYKVDLDYVCPCTFSLAVDQQPFDLPTYSGVTRKYIVYGSLACKYKKEVINLNLYKNLTLTNAMYQNHLLLPFKDHTNGIETYGGGRYLDINKLEIVDQKIIIDFNKSYNPWCAYSDGFNCPIPPTENHLKIKIEAGEKNYKGEKKH